MRSFLAFAVLLSVSALACSKKAPATEQLNSQPSSVTTVASAPLPVATAATPRSARAIGDTGYVITLPDGFELKPGFGDPTWTWTVEGPYEHFGSLPHTGEVATIRLWGALPKKAQETARLCGKERLDLVAEDQPSGGLFVSCHGESVGVSIPGMKIATYKVEMSQPLTTTANGRHESIVCVYEADNAALTKFTAQVCRSLRKG